MTTLSKPSLDEMTTQDLNHLIHKLSVGSRLVYEQQKEFAEEVEESWNLSQGLPHNHEKPPLAVNASPSPVEANPYVG